MAIGHQYGDHGTGEAGHERRYALWSILPAMLIDAPVTCGPMVFCTTAHLGQYPLARSHESKAIELVRRRIRDVQGRRIRQVGVMLAPVDDVDRLGESGLPRMCRDALALCHITAGTAQNCSSGQVLAVENSDYFDTLPLCFHDSRFAIVRPGLASGGWYLSELFPCLPIHLTCADADRLVLDKRLLSSLHCAALCLLKNPSNRQLRQVFRSISIATRATRILQERDSTYDDLGVLIVNWVSAFEILVHSGRDRVGFRDVLSLIKTIRWHDRGACAVLGGRTRAPLLSARRYRIRLGKGTVEQVNAGGKLYRRLYDLRNDFAHGNRIRFREVAARVGHRRGAMVVQAAALLYRELLLVRLRDLGITPAGQDLGDSIESWLYQGALVTALFSEDRWRSV